MNVLMGVEIEFCTAKIIGETYPETCSTCNGHGNTTYDCNICSGTGIVMQEGEEGEVEIPCRYCHGRGQIEDTCDDCDGSGEVEIEDEETDQMIRAMKRGLSRYGEVKTDGSIRPYQEEDMGREFASDALPWDGNGEMIKDMLYTVTQLIDDADGYSKASASCGVHVHISPGKDNKWSVEHIKNLANAWWEWAEESFYDKFRYGPNERDNWCQQWHDYSRQSPVDERAEHPARVVPSMTGTKYFSLNIHDALLAHGTVEFRLFDGTLDAEELWDIVRWVHALVLSTSYSAEEVDFAKELRTICADSQELSIAQ